MARQRDLKERAYRAVGVWVDCFSKHDLLTNASAIAFQVLKSLVPLVLLGLALLGAIGRRDLWNRQLGPGVRRHVTPSAYHALDAGVQKIFANNSTPLLVFAALLTVWYVSGAVRGIMGGINCIYEAAEDRPFGKRWPLSFALSLGVVTAVVGAALLVEAVPRPGGALDWIVVPVRWLGAIVALSAAAGLLVRFGPAKQRSKAWASAGGLLIVLSWIVTSLVFRWYVSSIANFKTAVGQLTVFIVLMVWVYASAIVFLVGVQLDELLRADATSGERGILGIVFGTRR